MRRLDATAGRLGLTALLAVVALGAAGSVGGAVATTETACPAAAAAGAAPARIRQVLASGRDVWGEALLAAPGGPTLAGARRHLSPLVLARGPGGRPLTASGVYYLPFSQPDGPRGAGTVALHVADGSQVLAERVGGQALTVRVGLRGDERYGSCRSRLQAARLAEGWLPILQTGYVDRAGARYAQESFVTRLPGSRRLVSVIRLAVDARAARAAVTVRVGIRSARVPRGEERTLRLAWPGERVLDEEAYGAARASVERYWEGRLAPAAQLEVPEPEVQHAVRALLAQALTLTWRYSIGNPYEQFSFPESPDVARVLAAYGLFPAARSVLRTSITRDETRYRNWKRGSRLVALADHHRLSGDAATVRGLRPRLRGWVADLERQVRTSGGLLARERYSSDIPDQVLGLHAQAVVWEGLRAMAPVWAATGDATLAARARTVAARLGAGLRRAVAASQRRLPDGSLFVPVRLLDGERAYGLVVEERAGSYWNLVAPYAFASGLFPPGGPQARGVLRYLERHGARLLGMVRAGAYALYGRDAYPASGTNHVYNLAAVRFLADNDEADQLVLALYGSLAAGLTPRTFVAGEAASVAPLPGADARAMYLPPNGASGAAFLENVRALLVHETRDRSGAPKGLRLAHATPRGWLRPGGRIAVRDLPTSFGAISYTIERRGSVVEIALEPPARRPASLRVRLRLPGGGRLGAVEADGAAVRLDRRTGTIDLSRTAGTVTVRARVLPQ